MSIDLKGQKWFVCFASAVLITGVSISYDIAPMLQSIYRFQNLFGLLSFVVLLYFYVRQRKMTVFDFVAFTYVLFLLLTTLLSGTDVGGAIHRAIEVMTLIMIFNYFSDRFSLVIKTMALTFSMCIYMNSIIMLLLPDWMTEAYNQFDSYLIGGNYNQMGGRILPGLVLDILCLRYGRRWWINMILYFVMSMWSLGIVGSMTSLASLIIFAILCMLKSPALRSVALGGYFAVYVLFQVFVVFSGGGLKDNPLAVYLIKDVMGKDMTFTNRTVLWDAAGRIFSESPLIGYGWVPGEWYVAHMTNVAIGPHNFIYSVLVNGGLVLFAILIFLVFVSLRNNNFKTSYYSWILVSGILTYAFMMLMEVYPFFFLFLLLTVTYYNSRRVVAEDRITKD